eukprot:CAMPEP_0203912348 /NCGR_PEP_ID=MMETSP0359-20131031/53433_1 /ASSEMBLY_ACC=CAM_ASM_000338 /TAXON_ID=268821 /ORGANISM="Scrippsiella Hangoei, Strain SHTV-5" /LENGTH=105 /DNA_ID=CAMNT_0050838269 /DNA_START=120 /DNA_END=437 /DNA_ORIENTATION=-
MIQSPPSAQDPDIATLKAKSSRLSHSAFLSDSPSLASEGSMASMPLPGASVSTPLPGASRARATGAVGAATATGAAAHADSIRAMARLRAAFRLFMFKSATIALI